MEIPNKKVFVSYCWSSLKHEEWVLTLAEELIGDGVEVVLDKWDLKPGHDKFIFMEQMVQAKDIDKVLIILDKQYAGKANERSGGVGTETTIISGEVYKSVTQDKFIPIIVERDEEGEPFLPIYLNGRVYIDLSTEENYASEYEKLLRDIFVRPSLAKPKLGKPPRYLFEQSPISSKTGSILRSFDSQVDRHPKRIDSIVQDFFDELVKDLRELKIVDKQQDNLEYGKDFVERINDMLTLRDNYIDLIDKLSKYGYDFNTDLLIRFFEQLPGKLCYPSAAYNWENHEFKVFRFLVHELWLYTIAAYLKREIYDVLSKLLQGDYYTNTEIRSASKPAGFQAFYFYAEDVDPYYKSIGHNLVSSHAHLLVNRPNEKISKEEFIAADLICYYISHIHNWYWFPITYIYRDDRNSYLPIFSKISSKRHFEKVKAVLGMDSLDMFIIKMREVGEQRERGYSNSHSRVPALVSFIPMDSIGKYS